MLTKCLAHLILVDVTSEVILYVILVEVIEYLHILFFSCLTTALVCLFAVHY
jgi:hypothetical protein